MTSVAFIGTFTKDTPVYLYLSQGATRSDSLRQTSWSAFLIDNLMYPLIIFCTRPTQNVLQPTGKSISILPVPTLGMHGTAPKIHSLHHEPESMCLL